MKKFISFLSACLLALSCIAFNASADDSLISNSVLMYPVYRSAAFDSLSERFDIPKDITYTFTVDLRNINWPEIMENRSSNGLDNIDFPLECVLTSNVRFMPHGNSYFDDAFDEAYGFRTGSGLTDFGNLFDTFETESSFYDHFISEGWKDSPWYIYTKDFSFTDSLPDYVPFCYEGTDSFIKLRRFNKYYELFFAKQKEKYPDLVYLSPHKLRHSYATYLIQSGADIETLRALLGHVDIMTTQRYVHSNLQQMQRAVAKLRFE